MDILKRFCDGILRAFVVLAYVGCLLSVGYLIYNAIQFAILPAKYVWPGIAILIIFYLNSLVSLIKNKKKHKNKKHRKKPSVVGRIVAAILLLICILVSSVGNYYFYHSRKAVGHVANVREETTSYGLYVSATSSYKEVSDLSGKTLGGMKSIKDGKNEEILEQIQEDLGKCPDVNYYEDVITLTDGLLDKEVDGIFLNEAYIDVLTETEGYEDRADDLKLLKEYDVKTVVETEDTAVEPGQPFLVYISGMDTWGHITTASRSDVNILAAVNPQTNQILLVSTPRDYYVPLSVSNGAKDKLTHAGIYGIEASEDTMEMLYDVNIDYYVKINFSGFEGLIDAMGGITVWSDYDFTVDPIKHYVVGENKLTGLEALAFARERHAFSNGDRQRGINQMNVIQSVIDKLTSTALLKNYQGIMEECDGTFATDMTSEEIADFISYQISSGTSWDIQKYSVSGSGATKSVYSLSKAVYVMEPNEDDVELGKELLTKVLNGETVDVSAYTEGTN